MRKTLKLQHHKHTGKLLPHKHTSYRVLFLLLLLTGGFLAMVHYATVKADDIIVTAKVSAPIPTVPAQILSPEDGLAVSDPNITVSGTCQIMNPAVIVAIYRDGVLLGSTVCEDDGTFSVDVVLRVGSNTLIARTVNITQDYGPDSTPVTVTYNPPEPPPQPETPPRPGEPGAGQPGSPATGPATPAPGTPGGPSELVLRSQDAFLTYGPGKAACWIGSFDGGQPPYTVTITWGDGGQETHTALTPGNHEFCHKYSQQRTYFVTITITDSAGQTLLLHLVALSPFLQETGPPPPVISTTDYISFPTFYGAYVVLVLVGGLIWYEAQIGTHAFIHWGHLGGRKKGLTRGGKRR